MKARNIKWEETDLILENLAIKIGKMRTKFDFVIGIPRGGLVPGVILSHKLDIPYMEFSDFIKKPFEYANILLVDDISDSGKTLKRSLRFFERSKTKIVTLYFKDSTKIMPDIHGTVTPDDIWLVFPWEK